LKSLIKKAVTKMINLSVYLGSKFFRYGAGKPINEELLNITQMTIKSRILNPPNYKYPNDRIFLLTEEVNDNPVPKKAISINKLFELADIFPVYIPTKNERFQILHYVNDKSDLLYQYLNYHISTEGINFLGYLLVFDYVVDSNPEPYSISVTYDEYSKYIHAAYKKSKVIKNQYINKWYQKIIRELESKDINLEFPYTNIDKKELVTSYHLRQEYFRILWEYDIIPYACYLQYKDIDIYSRYIIHDICISHINELIDSMEPIDINQKIRNNYLYSRVVSDTRELLLTDIFVDNVFIKRRDIPSNLPEINQTVRNTVRKLISYIPDDDLYISKFFTYNRNLTKLYLLYDGSMIVVKYGSVYVEDYGLVDVQLRPIISIDIY